jgi:hypothetical protein
MAPASVLLPFHTNLQRSPKMVNCGQPCLMKVPSRNSATAR